MASGCKYTGYVTDIITDLQLDWLEPSATHRSRSC